MWGIYPLNPLTQLGKPAENYSFCTIDTDVGIVSAPDPSLYNLTDKFKPFGINPATIKIYGYCRAGKMRPEEKNYIVQNGYVIFFKFNA